MGPGSFSFVIIWYFQALIYIHGFNTALFKNNRKCIKTSDS